MEPLPCGCNAAEAITSLRQGADSCQKTDLPACVQPNAKSAVKNGEAVTDTVATWVKKGFSSYTIPILCHNLQFQYPKSENLPLSDNLVENFFLLLPLLGL